MGLGGNIILFLIKISMLWFFLGLFTISKWIKQYFPRKRIKKIYFALNLTQKVNILRLDVETLFFSSSKITILTFHHSLYLSTLKPFIGTLEVPVPNYLSIYLSIYLSTLKPFIGTLEVPVTNYLSMYLCIYLSIYLPWNHS